MARCSGTFVTTRVRLALGHGAGCGAGARRAAPSLWTRSRHPRVRRHRHRLRIGEQRRQRAPAGPGRRQPADTPGSSPPRDRGKHGRPRRPHPSAPVPCDARGPPPLPALPRGAAHARARQRRRRLHRPRVARCERAGRGALRTAHPPSWGMPGEGWKRRGLNVHTRKRLTLPLALIGPLPRTARPDVDPDGTCVQNIAVPNTVWSLACTDRGDLAVGCGDRKAYLFTRDATRAASDSDREALEKALSAKSSGCAAPCRRPLRPWPHRGRNPPTPSVPAAARLPRSTWLHSPAGRTGRATRPSRVRSRSSTRRASPGPRAGMRWTTRGWRCACAIAAGVRWRSGGGT